MSEKKPRPSTPTTANKRCPVCGEVSYSRDGIHPQCSVRKADEEQTDRRKQEALQASTEQAEKPKNSAARWQKQCPKCKALQHVRKAVCTCGHKFATAAVSREPESEQE